MNALLTRVELLSLRRWINVYLRFGKPARVQVDAPHRRSAFFQPTETFCRIWWERNDYGTTRWELAILQAPIPSNAAQRVIGIRPGAQILLRVDGARLVKRTLSVFTALERDGFALPSISPTYWRVLNNRLVAGQDIGCYDMRRHAAATWHERIK